MTAVRGVLLLAVLAAPGGLAAQEPSRQAMLSAEDRRSMAEADLAPLLNGLRSPNEAVAVAALRGLGRFERGTLVARVVPALDDSRPLVRIEAIWALGQLGQDSAAAPTVATILLDRLALNTDLSVQAALARSLARLPLRDPVLRSRISDALDGLLRQDGPADYVLEVTRAAESFARLAGRGAGQRPATIARLEALTAYHGPTAAPAIRRAAAQTLLHAGARNPTVLSLLALDVDPGVRRLATLWAADSAAIDDQRGLLLRLMADPATMVRIEAVRSWSRQRRALDCAPLLAAARDPELSVALEAIGAIDASCPDRAAVAQLLGTLVDSLVAADRAAGPLAWHRGARALLSLAALDPDRAGQAVPTMARSSRWHLRMYAARAATSLKDETLLRALAADEHDNVREAAITALVAVAGPAADSIYRAQLGRPDYQLVQTAARALAGSPAPRATVDAALAALRRISAEGKDTSRDPRVALMDRLNELGQPADSAALRPYLTDFDPVIAERAAAILTRWSGRTVAANPARAAPAPVSVAAADALRGARLRITMMGAAGRSEQFEVTLYPELAPATVLRIVTRAREGYYDGLTFHRIVPNFVIQGGSPGANEYVGDGPYMRDEVSATSHERGTLGISTRGRDTGDAQIFVNLVDNLRLDFNYTVWGRVTDGMDVVDRIAEGDVMRRVEVLSTR